MLRQALEGVRTNLNDYMAASIANANNGPIVRLINIAGVDLNSGQTPTDTVMMSLVSIEEETSLKNGSTYRQHDSFTKVRVNPILFMNCYVLFAINSTNETNYLNALLLLSNVISFFQHKHVFTHENTPALDPKIEKLIAELYSPNFEQMNHLWAMLGGRYMPSVLYRLRMLMMEDTQPESQSIITTIDINSHRI